jgi:hypothetical protein
MILTQDKKDIASLRESLVRVKDEIGSMRVNADEVAKSFAIQTNAIQGDTREIKDGMANMSDAVGQVAKQSVFNFDVLGLMLSQNIISGLHEKINSAIDMVDLTNKAGDERADLITAVLKDSIDYIEKVEAIANDKTEVEGLKTALQDTNAAIEQIKTETVKGRQSFTDKQTATQKRITDIATALDGLSVKLAELAEQKPKIITVKDADGFRIANKGVYSPDNDYSKGDIVRHASASWIALASTSESPSDKATDWALLARDGRGGGSPVAPIAGAVIDDETPALDKTYSSEKIEQLTAHTWTDYVTRAEYVETNGQVLTYTFEGASVFRFVPQNPYVYAEDAFFSDSELTTLLAARI